MPYQSDRLPSQFQFDRYESSACVSLVAFDFLKTKVLGVGWPGFINFPEVNLRFYVQSPEHRGFMFIKELVPSRLTAWIARISYNEPYEAHPMVSSQVAGDNLQIKHHIRKDQINHELSVTCGRDFLSPGEESVEHFFKEHQWGFGLDHRGRTLHYEVRHPAWRTRLITAWNLNIDFEKLYGHPWGILNKTEPFSVIYAEGSAIEVFSPKRLV